MKSLAIVITLFGAGVAAWLTPAPMSSSPGFDQVECQGVISGMRLDMDGAVYVRLECSADAAGGTSKRDFWFRSPPDRSAAISVEEMLLDVVLDTDPGETLTVTYEKDRTLDGEKPDSAIPVLHVQKP